MRLSRIGISCIKLTPYSFLTDLRVIDGIGILGVVYFPRLQMIIWVSLIFFNVKVLLWVFFDYSMFQSQCYPKRGLGKYWIEFQSEELFLKGVHGTRLWGQVTKKSFWKWSDHFVKSWKWESKMWDTLGAWRASF